MRIANWDKWQTYRKDRGTPPWIKVHRNLMSNPEWAVLSDCEKGQLVSMWIVAADKDGSLPDDPAVLRKMCQLDDSPNVKKFMDLGFIESTGCQRDANVTPTRQPSDAPETETETETETEKPRELKFAEGMFFRISKTYPNTRKPNLAKWANDIRLTIDRDNRDPEELWKLFIWAHEDDFWSTNILSPKKLREHFDKLQAKRQINTKVVNMEDAGRRVTRDL